MNLYLLKEINIKRIRVQAEYSSIFNDSKYLCEISIKGFSSAKTKENRKFIEDVVKLAVKYEGVKHAKRQSP